MLGPTSGTSQKTCKHLVDAEGRRASESLIHDVERDAGVDETGHKLGVVKVDLLLGLLAAIVEPGRLLARGGVLLLARGEVLLLACLARGGVLRLVGRQAQRHPLRLEANAAVRLLVVRLVLILELCRTVVMVRLTGTT